VAYFLLGHPVYIGIWMYLKCRTLRHVEFLPLHLTTLIHCRMASKIKLCLLYSMSPLFQVS